MSDPFLNLKPVLLGTHERKPSHLAPAEERAKIVEENKKLEAKRAAEAPERATRSAVEVVPLLEGLKILKSDLKLCSAPSTPAVQVDLLSS